MTPNLLLASNGFLKYFYQFWNLFHNKNMYKINIRATEYVLYILVIEQEINLYNTTIWTN